MIRDPSDGSVKEITPEANEINRLAAKQSVEGIAVSGLRPPSQRHDVQARLEASRSWLKEYFQRKTGASQ